MLLWASAPPQRASQNSGHRAAVGGTPTTEGSQNGGGGSGPGRAWQEVELSTSVTSDYVTSQAGGRRPGFQLRAGCQVVEKGFTAVAAPGGTTKKWVSMVLVTRDLIEG